MRIFELAQSDYEIRNYHKLDRILVELCKMVVDGKKQDPGRYGAVAAAVLDPKNNLVKGINLPAGDGKRRHAERVAMDNYKKKYGEIPEGSIIITTCSPCSEHMAERHGDSCTDLINSSPVKKVYCGYIDRTQPEDSRTFNEIETANPAIRNLCRDFASTFMDAEEEEANESLRTENPCWKGYHPVGTKKKNGRTVPNCVPEAANPAQQAAIAIAKKKKKHK
jgi:pyrimidine deaminase RibD-like protein